MGMWRIFIHNFFVHHVRPAPRDIQCKVELHIMHMSYVCSTKHVVDVQVQVCVFMSRRVMTAEHVGLYCMTRYGPLRVLQEMMDPRFDTVVMQGIHATEWHWLAMVMGAEFLGCLLQRRRPRVATQ
jgi:hypothetical protein